MQILRAPALVLLASLVAGALVLGACGDDDDDAEETSAPVEATATQVDAPRQPRPPQRLDETATGPTDGAIEVIQEAESFAPNHLLVPLNQAVTLRITNTADTQHNIRVAGLDGRYETEDDALIAVIASGDVGELVFSGAFPGSYTFRCDFHPSDMGGAIVVE
jgi:plastocyanin